MKRITRALAPTDLADLLAASTSASVACQNEGELMAAPAAFLYDAGRYCIGVPVGVLRDGAEVAVVMDEGPMYFDLRGVRVRGPVAAIERADDGLEWFDVVPEREVAWHYGTLRER
jgi:hypothetical protein